MHTSRFTAVGGESRAVEAERNQQEETGRSKKKHHMYNMCKVGMDLGTAASKLQAAIQTNKKNGCHPQSIETSSKMFKDLRAGKEVVDVHKSSQKSATPSSLLARSLQGWLCIASSSDIDAVVAELYA